MDFVQESNRKRISNPNGGFSCVYYIHVHVGLCESQDLSIVVQLLRLTRVSSGTEMHYKTNLNNKNRHCYVDQNFELVSCT